MDIGDGKIATSESDEAQTGGIGRRGPVGRPAAAAVLLGLLLVAAAVAPAGVAAQSATISLSVDGESVAADGETLVTTDPRVGVDVSAESTIESIILRVNGSTVETFEPGEPSFSETYRVPLEDGVNEVTVVAQTADGVDSRTVTITKDDRAPFVRFTSPFETGHHRSVIPDSVGVNDSVVTLSGELHDASGVERITITRRYTYTHANTERVSNARWDVENPSDSFSQQIFLGDGSNAINVRVEDRFGHSRVYALDLNVTDTQKPDIDLRLPNETHGSTLEIGGGVRDNGQVDYVEVSVEGALGSKRLFDGIDGEPDESAISVPISGTAPLRPGENTVTVTATDLAGNTAEVNGTVVYTRSVVPIVRFDREGTAVESSGDVRVSGVVEDGEITGVTVESVAVESGEVVDLARTYSGSEVRSEVTISETLALADGRTRVVVRATDSNGDEHRTSFLVDPETGDVDWDGSVPEASEPETGGNESTEQASNESAAQDDGGDGGEDGSGESTAAPATAAAVTDGLPLPGFTAVTAALALGLLSVLALAARSRPE